MNAKFDIGGYVLEISENGHLSSQDGMCSAAKGQVGLQVTYLPLTLSETEGMTPKLLVQAFVSPSQARAIASAILSAATEAKGL